MRFRMMPPIDLRRTMTIQIPALEWICNSEGYLRMVEGITQRISPYPLQGPLSSHLDMERVQPDEMQWTPLLKLSGRDPYIRKLRNFFTGLYFMTGQDPFQCLILTVLTQNKTAERARSAFYELIRRFGTITPETLSVLDPRDIVPVLYQCGPHRKAEYIVAIAREIMRQWDGDLSWVYDAPDHARELLVSLPGVGKKTADCVLLYAAGHEVVPIDTHVERVACRLGFIERGASRRGLTINAREIHGSDKSKDIAKEALETELADPGRSHLLLIQHGFEFCHATAPECFACPIRYECPSIDNCFKSTAP
ncbi:MAG: endonuclease III domain-containing protein [Halobacteriota archaeon]